MSREHIARPASRRGFLRAAGAAGVVGLAGCVSEVDDGGGDGGNGDGGEIGTIRYGVLEPLTGPFSDLGEERLQGTELAIEQINESDEFAFEIEFETYDTQSDTATAQREASRAVEEFDASYLTGCISSSVALGINDFARNNGVIYTPGAADVSITGENCNEYVFRFETSTAQIAEVMAQWTVDTLGDRLWYHIADYAYGDSVLEEVETRMESIGDGYERVDVTRSEFGATDFEAFISQISNSADEIDAVVVGMTGGDLAVFLSQAARQGLTETVPIVTTTASFRPIRVPIGSDGYGVYSGVRYLPDLDTGDNRSFVEAYQEAYDDVPDNFSRVGYESIRMVARGIQEAESGDPEDVKEALSDLEMETIFGRNRFRACDHQAVNPVWMGRLVEPDEGDAAAVELLADLDGEDAAPPCDQTGCQLG
ncbi:ABC transporter substrate-binding protein [Haloferacaceae archaeon DSL9]